MSARRRSTCRAARDRGLEQGDAARGLPARPSLARWRFQKQRTRLPDQRAGPGEGLCAGPIDATASETRREVFPNVTAARGCFAYGPAHADFTTRAHPFQCHGRCRRLDGEGHRFRDARVGSPAVAARHLRGLRPAGRPIRTGCSTCRAGFRYRVFSREGDTLTGGGARAGEPRRHGRVLGRPARHAGWCATTSSSVDDVAEDGLAPVPHRAGRHLRSRRRSAAPRPCSSATTAAWSRHRDQPRRHARQLRRRPHAVGHLAHLRRDRRDAGQAARLRVRGRSAGAAATPSRSRRWAASSTRRSPSIAAATPT